MEEKIVVAADFGNGKIAVAAAFKKEENQIEMIDFKSKSIENLVSDGKIVDENALASEVIEMIKQIETDNNLQIEKVHFAAAPHTLRSDIRNVDIETSDLADLNEELMDKAEEIEISDTRRVFDAIPLEITTIGNNKAEGKFLVVSTQNAVKQQFMDLKDSSLSAYKPQYFVAPLVEAEQFLSSTQKKNGALLVDMGLGCTSFAVYQNGLPRLCAVIPLGSKHISSDIEKKFNIQTSTAEKLKTAAEYGLAIEKDLKIGGVKSVEAEELKKIISARLNEIFNFIFDEIKSQKLENIREIVLVGGGAKMNFLPEFLKKISNAEIKIADFEVITNSKTEKFVCPKNALLFALLKNCDEICGKIKQEDIPEVEPLIETEKQKKEREEREKREEKEKKKREKREKDDAKKEKEKSEKERKKNFLVRTIVFLEEQIANVKEEIANVKENGIFPDPNETRFDKLEEN